MIKPKANLKINSRVEGWQICGQAPADERTLAPARQTEDGISGDRGFAAKKKKPPHPGATALPDAVRVLEQRSAIRSL